MKVGSLGGVVFEVSKNQIKTIRDVKWSGSASIQSHQIHLDNPTQEFVGNDADGFTFKIKVAKYLGSDPQTDIAQLFTYMRNGTTLPLTLGTKKHGKYRWLIKKLSIDVEYFDKFGNVTSADLSVTLTEYT